MSEEQAFLRAIAASPEDDTLRLVYADWLEENGQSERAEFIRVQCEMAQINPDPWTGYVEWENPRYCELENRARELHDRYSSEWFATLLREHGGSDHELMSYRGFPYHIGISARKFIDRGEAIFRAAPTIEDVIIDQLGRNMPKLARTAALGHVCKLAFFETPFHAPEAEHLAASPHLGNLRGLDISMTDTQIGPLGASALAGAKSLRQLRQLDISGHAITDVGAGALIRSERLATLTEIELGYNELTDYTLEVLGNCKNMKLTSLDLMGNHISGEGLSALAAPHLAGLEYFSLHGNPIGQTGAADVTRASCAPGLRTLSVANCGLDDKAVAALLGGDWPQLADLRLFLNGLGSRAAKALAGNRSLGRLESLNLKECGIGPAAARQMGRASLPALHGLYAEKNPLGPKGLRGLLAGPLLAPVRSLDLNETELGDEGAEILARSTTVANLRSLGLATDGITNRGAIAVAESPHLAGLRSLNLRHNKIGKKGRDALLKRFGERVTLSDD